MSYQPRKVIIHRSINRPQVLLGGERKLVQLSMLIAFLIALSGMSLYSVFIAIAVWAVFIAVLRRLAKNDTQMSAVYIRFTRYKEYYPARSGLYSIPKRIKDWSS